MDVVTGPPSELGTGLPSGSRLHPELLSGYGLVEAPIDRVAATFGDHDRADQSKVRVRRHTTDPADVVEFLRLRTWPTTRLALIGLGEWTAVLTNRRGGSDFADHWFWAGRSLGARTIRVVDQGARWASGKPRRRLAFAARIVEIHDADGSTVRSIAAADDGGRWVFETFGDPLPIEASFDYTDPNRRRRFTSENLRQLLTSLGPGPLTDHRFPNARSFVLLDERYNLDSWQKRIEEAATTLEL